MNFSVSMLKWAGGGDEEMSQGTEFSRLLFLLEHQLTPQLLTWQAVMQLQPTVA